MPARVLAAKLGLDVSVAADAILLAAASHSSA